MAQPNDQAKAGSGAEGATGEPQGDQVDSLNNPGKEQTFGERISSASSRADIMRLTAEAMQGRAVTKPEEAAAKAPADTNGAPVIEGEGGAGEGAAKTGDGEIASTAAEGATETAAAAEGEPKGDEAKAAEGAQAQAAATDAATKEGEEEKLPDRIRLTNFSKVEKLALTIKRENPNLTLAEAEVKARDALGIAAPDKSTAADGAAPALPATLADVDAKIKELTAQRTKAFEDDLDFKAANRLTLEIEALKDHKLTLREQASQKASAEQAEYDAAFDAAQKKAAGLYDFVKQPDSAGFKRMAEIDRQLEANKDPLFDSPDKPLVIAQMAAKELQIAPKSPTAKAAATTAAVKTVAAKPAVDASKKTVPPVASGASRTTTASTQGDGLAKKIVALRTPQDIENFLAELPGS
jgi:hypothetical protein